MKRWENGEYIDLTPEEEKSEAARRAAAEAEEAEQLEREQQRLPRIESFRAKAKAGRVTLDDLRDIVLMLIGE